MIESEAEEFVKWLGSLEEAEPLCKDGAYGKVFDATEKAPKAGMKIYTIYGQGTLTVWPNALVFLASPPKGAAATILGTTVAQVAGRFTWGASHLLTAAVGKVSGDSSVEKILELALNEWSIFMPLERIEKIDGGKGFLSILFGQSLDIHYRDFSDKPVHAYLWSPAGSFSSREIRNHIDAAMEKLA